MSSKSRNAEKRREREEQMIREEEERMTEEHRVAGLTWYQRIEEIDDIRDAKAVLHEIVDRLDEVLASRGGFERNPEI